MKALCWEGVGRVAVRTVPDPRIDNARDAIVKVTASSVCGSDLHLIDGYVPGMREGDILGHEFVGEVVEIGPAVRTLAVGDRVVVASTIGCGGCWFCDTDQWSLCDNTNPNAALSERLWGQAPAAVFGSSPLTGGFAGSHAEYVRVPFADYGVYRLPPNLPDDAAVYASDAAPTGWMAAEMCRIGEGDVVAVWGAGGVGQLAARAALVLGAERVIVIDRYSDRLDAARENLGVATIDYQRADVQEVLEDMTAGRGPDACIEAVGMEADNDGGLGLYDLATGRTGQSERPVAVREAILACRKGGTVAMVGVFAGLADRFPLGALMHKGLTLRSGQPHSQRYLPLVLDRMARGDIWTDYLTTHSMPLSDGPFGYELFKYKIDGCLRVVFHPQA
ncbi:glutathione-dependent formaldehyde dehydrogenase [Planosporangium flavigriseum]|uniref:zinc-dependent alcohol dehydrogenase n=1 Tax=Planosporangium flavigriseum TaxID=373681 RepID=UPI00143C1C06|nr:zinc-dependent alcohol dehydrogenase [Planosporangium flavigriseum]NJC67228.1 glutathione-dependent formaldehyde dehydrogenase [Planosporangium flavigriseum]